MADMAAFVVNLGFTPTEYYKLSIAEREAIIKFANRKRS